MDRGPSLTTLHAQSTPSGLINRELPKWVRVGFDHRFRLEGYTALRNRDGNNDRWFLNRRRANLTLAPTGWLSFTAQAQDSRIFGKSNPHGRTPFINRTDLRLGRQELAYGDERLIGAANWGKVARTFRTTLPRPHRPLRPPLRRRHRPPLPGSIPQSTKPRLCTELPLPQRWLSILGIMSASLLTKSGHLTAPRH